MLEHFPKSQLGQEARVLIAKNNEDLAKQLYDKAVVFQGAKRYANSNALADQIEARFPNSRFSRQAKQLKEANKEKQREDQQAQEAGLIAQKQAAARRGCDLELLSWNWYIEHGFAQAEGQVKNISGKNMENVLAVVTFYDASDVFIKADSALIEYNPILPGQTSPFKVMTTQNPAMKKASVEFKSFWGGIIRTYVANK